VGRYRYDGILGIVESHVGPRQGHAVQAADLTQFDHIREARQWPSLCAASFSPTRLHDAREKPPRPFSEVFGGLLKVVAEVSILLPLPLPLSHGLVWEPTNEELRELTFNLERGLAGISRGEGNGRGDFSSAGITTQAFGAR
jgi:hypothetical protein